MGYHRDAAGRRVRRHLDHADGDAQPRGEQMSLKYVSVDGEWIVRACGALDCRRLTLLESGLLARLPAEIDNAVVAAAPYRSRQGHRGAAILMRDMSSNLVPGGS